MKFEAYFVDDLGMEAEQALTLHRNYYTKYGLALRGLIRHHDVGKIAARYEP